MGVADVGVDDANGVTAGEVAVGEICPAVRPIGPGLGAICFER